MQQRLRHALPVLLAAAIGLWVSITIENVKRQLDSDANFASFCNVNARVNCDVVLSSDYANLFGVSVSLLACLYYGGMLLLAAGLVYSESFSRRRSLAAALFAGSIFGLIFSIYMAYVAFFVLNTVCLLCSALYLVSLVVFVFSWRLRTQLAPRTASRREVAASSNDRWIVAGSLLAAVALIALAMWEALLSATPALSAEMIRSEKPEFYEWFHQRPIEKVSADVGNSVGPRDAPVTIVEFSDFGCGHCAALSHTLEQLLRSERDKSVRIVFRHFPLDSACNAAIKAGGGHKQSCLAATAAECAGEQNQFWPYQRALFENQSHFKRSELVEYARAIGLDLGKFETCLQSEAARQRVARDAAEGMQLQIQSTPTFFINGRKIEGALDSERLADALTLARESK
ncbi:MAG TPA: thioredoxin domain-containing protein [Terriglobales bacterium]|nr:thioredoxin domain-containing protein [Terriglobales bacterium]